MEKTIEITIEDIQAGQRAKAFGCPASRAFTRVYGRTGTTHCASIVTDSGLTLRHSDDLIQFVQHFDDGREVEPGEYAYEEK